MRWVLILTVVCCSVGHRNLLARVDDASLFRIGQLVTVKSDDATLTDNGKPITAHVAVGENFKVIKIDGDRLKIRRGWIGRRDVVPYDDAIDFFALKSKARRQQRIIESARWSTAAGAIMRELSQILTRRSDWRQMKLNCMQRRARYSAPRANSTRRLAI